MKWKGISIQIKKKCNSIQTFLSSDSAWRKTILKLS